MRVEAATIEDSRAIAEVHVASWQSSYAGILSAEYLASLSVEKREASWRKGFQEGSPEVLVARSEIGVVGFVAFGACRDQGASLGCGEIWAIYLLPSSWSAGIGRELW